MIKKPKLKKTAPKIIKGRVNVKKQLINSAAELLADLGPNQVSVRVIADHAGVHHA
jgi:AcrR family transcriptional regulator